MKKFLTKLLAYKTPAVTLAAGVIAALYLSPAAFKDTTQELMALFGLMMAAVLPTMVLTASTLRASNLSIKRLGAYHNALTRQMRVWLGLFLISLGASILVIVGKMLDWTAPIYISKIPYLTSQTEPFDAIRLINSAISMCATLLIFRAFAVGRGILSLLNLSLELAEGEARLRDDERHQKVEAEIARMAERPNFGDYVELKH